MEKAKNFTDLIVWQKAHKFVLAIYQLSKNFPKDELFTLDFDIIVELKGLVAYYAETI
jgi:hypothetical protein